MRGCKDKWTVFTVYRVCRVRTVTVNGQQYGHTLYRPLGKYPTERTLKVKGAKIQETSNSVILMKLETLNFAGMCNLYCGCIGTYTNGGIDDNYSLGLQKTWIWQVDPLLTSLPTPPMGSCYCSLSILGVNPISISSKEVIKIVQKDNMLCWFRLYTNFDSPFVLWDGFIIFIVTKLY